MTQPEREWKKSYPERLKGIMVSRVMLVTLFLSGALFLDINQLNLSSPRNLTLMGLVVGTYLLTIIYGLWFKKQVALRKLAITQLVLDLCITSLLVLSTGGMRDSIFLFTMALPIIATALLLGRAAALVSATITGTLMLLLSFVAIGYLPNPYTPERLIIKSVPYIQRVFFEGAIQIVMAYVLAGISGQLAKQLGDINLELAQQRLDIKELQALNANILASLNSGLMTITNDQRIIFFNEAAQQITGLVMDDVFGAELADIFPEIGKSLQQTNPMNTLNAERRFEERYLHPDGTELTVGFSISLLRNADMELIGQIIIFQDLTSIKRLEYEAKRSEHLAAIGQLSAAIAHEIRNPLAAISGSVEMMQMLLDLDEDGEILMTIIVREVERLNVLITEFLEYSRPRPLILQEITLHKLIGEILILYKNKANAIEVVYDPDEVLKTFSVSADREALQQILWNLINNAHDAQKEQEDPRIMIDIKQTQENNLTQYITISVEDNGPGISKALRDKIFEPFFTTKNEGTGLGLATTFRLVENHQGICSYEQAQILSGARFNIALPINIIPFLGNSPSQSLGEDNDGAP